MPWIEVREESNRPPYPLTHFNDLLLAYIVNDLPKKALYHCREPVENLSDNLLRDFEDKWWKTCRDVRQPCLLLYFSE